MKLKNSNCDKLTNSNCYETQKLKRGQNSTSQIVTKLKNLNCIKNLNCDATQTIKNSTDEKTLKKLKL